MNGYVSVDPPLLPQERITLISGRSLEMKLTFGYFWRYFYQLPYQLTGIDKAFSLIWLLIGPSLILTKSFFFLFYRHTKKGIGLPKGVSFY